MNRNDQPDTMSIRAIQGMLRTVARVIPQQCGVVPDGQWNERTVRAVECFQKRRGLPVTGEADEATLEQLTAEYDHVRSDADPAAPIRICLGCGQILRRGEENHKVYLLQAMLEALAALAAEIPHPTHTGILDGETCRAVTAFQLKAGLRPTGEVDKRTWKALVLHFSAASDELSRRTGG